MPDYRTELSTLRYMWEDCTECSLGERRMVVGGGFVFGEGEGTNKPIMFIGEGPGVVEEQHGRPFIGPSGVVLRKTIAALKLTDYYITNIVACRSCDQAYNSQGVAIMRKDRRTGAEYPLIRDQPPNPLQISKCLPRLLEEIFLVDPLLIVTLGGEAAKALSGRAITITRERGKEFTDSVPGAWVIPSLTEKKRVWARKVRDQMVRPVHQNAVKYLVLPTLHPAFVLRNHADRRQGNPVDAFLEDMKLAAQIQDRYMFEVYGISPTEREVDASVFEED